ncbi:hypothetical protein I310_05986 [Cryptococcus deuterogattii CA1014]|nr:hypothetical protein I310_05986 [Cryptococcus deuterogattii CA1014]
MSIAIADTPPMPPPIPNLPSVSMLSPPNTHPYPLPYPQSSYRPPHFRARQPYSFGQPFGPPLLPINLKRTSSMRDPPKGATDSPDVDVGRDRETDTGSVHDQQQPPTPVTANSSRGKSRRRKDVLENVLDATNGFHEARHYLKVGLWRQG